jgi:hypothetical protein
MNIAFLSMRRTNFLTAWTAIGLWALAGGAGGAWETNRIRAALDITSTLPGYFLTVRSSDTFTRGPFILAYFSQFGSHPWAKRAKIDAFMVVSNRLVFSFDVDIKEGGVVYADEDLVAYNPVSQTFSMFFDGSTKLPASADVDSVARYLDDSQFLFSLDAPASVSGVGWVSSRDVLLYSGGFVSRLYSGTGELAIPARCNLDALHYEDGKIYFSLDTTARINSIRGGDHDIWVYDPSAGTVQLAAKEGLFPESSDLAALDYATDSDGDWLSDFEEASGVDELSTTVPGSIVALLPNGYISSSLVADSDTDGLSDGQEAIAGTNPTNSTDYLHLVSVRNTSEGQAVTWSSVNGKWYALEAGSRPDAYDTTVADYVYGEGSTVTITNTLPDPVAFYRIRLRFE